MSAPNEGGRKPRASCREDHPNWHGGRCLSTSGYVLINVGKGHHLADVRGYAYEHRLLAEEALGRTLRPDEVVHHLNGDQTDNRRENLEVKPSARHHRAAHRRVDRGLRGPDEPNPDVLCACGCGARFPRYDGDSRPRRFISGHNRLGDVRCQEVEA